MLVSAINENLKNVETQKLDPGKAIIKDEK